MTPALHGGDGPVGLNAGTVEQETKSQQPTGSPLGYTARYHGHIGRKAQTAPRLSSVIPPLHE